MVVLIGAAFGIALLAAVGQAVSGFGFALISVPLLIPLIGAPAAVAAATMLSFLLTLGSSVQQRAHVQWRTVAVVSATAVAGMPFGLLALQLLAARWLSLVIGCTVIVMVIVLARRTHGPVRDRPVRDRSVAAAGALSGALLTSTGMNGPPLVAALHGMGLAPRPFRASLQAAFVLQDAIAIVGFALVGRVTGQALTAVAAGIPGLVAGWLLGDLAFGRMKQETFRWIVLAMLTATGTVALVQAISG
ncbi:MAG: sulfite exporter TauE/SafE family protein [Actinomycetota bacterium]|nr:sulfite exporter TauE/SafE family protein [Actinomycetota bacterium]